MEENTVAFEIIAHAGDAMNSIMEALDCFACDNTIEAKQKLKQADHSMNQAHQLQTELIFKECNGHPQDVNLVMVHAQDHLMNAMLARQLVMKMMHVFEVMIERRDEK